MTDPLPQEIQVTELPRGVRYRLPPWELGGLKYLGLVMIVFGGTGGVLLSGCAVMSAVLQPQEGAVDWDWASAVKFVVFLYGLCCTVWIGAYLYRGHTEIACVDRWLYAIERAGPFRRTRRRSLAQLWQLTVTSRASLDGPRAAPTMLGALAALRADCERGKPLWLAVGYPRSLLRPLANDLARRCGILAGPSAEGGPHPLPVVEEKSEPASVAFSVNDVVPQLPHAARVLFEEDVEGITLTVPLVALWIGRTSALLFFSLIWCGVMMTITILAVVGYLQAAAGGFLYVLLPFLLLVWLAGIGLLVGASNMGHRRAVLAVVGETLVVLQTGFFGDTRREWPKGELASVHVGPSGRSVNDAPVLNLQIHARDGTQVGLLAGHGNAELEWMAAVLRQALRLQAGSATADSAPPSTGP